MIRAIGPKDHQEYLRLVDLFYHSEAVEHTIPPEYYERTFQELLRSNDYLEGYLLLEERKQLDMRCWQKLFPRKREVWSGGLKNCTFCRNIGEKDWAKLFSNGWTKIGLML